MLVLEGYVILVSFLPDTARLAVSEIRGRNIRRMEVNDIHSNVRYTRSRQVEVQHFKILQNPSDSSASPIKRHLSKLLALPATTTLRQLHYFDSCKSATAYNTATATLLRQLQYCDSFQYRDTYTIVTTQPTL